MNATFTKGHSLNNSTNEKKQTNNNNNKRNKINKITLKTAQKINSNPNT